jgi:hypothetical protein
MNVIWTRVGNYTLASFRFIRGIVTQLWGLSAPVITTQASMLLAGFELNGFQLLIRQHHIRWTTAVRHQLAKLIRSYVAGRSATKTRVFYHSAEPKCYQRDLNSAYNIGVNVKTGFALGNFMTSRHFKNTSLPCGRGIICTLVPVSSETCVSIRILAEINYLLYIISSAGEN